MEVWKPIADGYEVSNLGNIRSLKRHEPKILTPNLSPNGYLRIQLHFNGVGKHFSVHRLVAEAFIPNPDNKPQINHINGVKTDNHIENLEWCTPSENTLHAARTGLLINDKGANDSQAKLTADQVAWLRSVYVPFDENFGAKALAKKFMVSPTTIANAVFGKSYKEVDAPAQKTNEWRIPDKVRNEIRRLYKSEVRGCGSTTLAKKIGLSETTVKRILKENRQEPLQPHDLG